MQTIARDAHSNSGRQVGASSVTLSHTIGAGNGRILIVFASTRNVASNVITGVTYAGQALTQAPSPIDLVTEGFNAVSCWYLVNPPVGTANIVASISPANDCNLFGISYTGVASVGFPDASGNATTTSADNVSKSITTVADNAWIVAFGRGASGAPTSWTNATQIDSSNEDATADTNAAKTPPGAYSTGVTATGSSRVILVVLSLAPGADLAVAGETGYSAIM